MSNLPFESWLSYWPYLIAPAIGLVSAGLVLFVGRAVFGSRRTAAPPIRVLPPDPFEVGSAMERRVALRREGRHVRIFISDAAAQAKPFEGWILDRSVGGIRLSVGRPVEPDTLMSIRACDAPDTIPWTQVRVVRCSSHGHNYEWGCQFPRTPPWNVMLLFG